MSFEGDFRRDVRAEANLGACADCPQIVPEMRLLQLEVDQSAQQIQYALSDEVRADVTQLHINLTKEEDDPQGYNVPDLPPDVLDEEVVAYRQELAETAQGFDDYVSTQITSIRDTRLGCNGPIEGEIKVGAQTLRVVVCNHPSASPGPSLESVWVQRGSSPPTSI